MRYRRKTFDNLCTVCGQWYLTDIDPVKIAGAVTPTGGFICRKCRQAKQSEQRTPPSKTVQMTIDEIGIKK